MGIGGVNIPMTAPLGTYQVTGYLPLTSLLACRSPSDFCCTCQLLHRQGNRRARFWDWVPAHFWATTDWRGLRRGTLPHEYVTRRKGEHPDKIKAFDYSKNEVRRTLISNAVFG